MGRKNGFPISLRDSRPLARITEGRIGKIPLLGTCAVEAKMAQEGKHEDSRNQVTQWNFGACAIGAKMMT